MIHLLTLISLLMIFTGSAYKTSRNQCVSRLHRLDAADLTSCISHVDFNIIQVGTAGGLAGGFRGIINSLFMF